MDNRAEIREFLVTRRAKITPARAGITPGPGQRRVPGLRRDEVATLAGVSTEWYTRLEKGQTSGVSDQVLNAVARALLLDEAERRHLFDLARAGRATRPQRRVTTSSVRPSVLQILDSMSSIPAFVVDGRQDILAINALGRALYAPVFGHPGSPANLARFCFLDSRAHDFYPQWDQVSSGTVAVLRAEAGRDPYNRDLTDLVGELATRSDAFRIAWASHDVRLHLTGAKQIHHPVVGELHLTFNSLALPTAEDRGQSMTCYSAEPGSASDDALKLLASWSVSPDQRDRSSSPTATG